jgi:hypothetical protein
MKITEQNIEVEILTKNLKKIITEIIIIIEILIHDLKEYAQIETISHIEDNNIC